MMTSSSSQSERPIEKKVFDSPHRTAHAGTPGEETPPRPNYLLVFLALALFTGLEIGTSYLPAIVKIPTLIVLAVTKAALVVLFFMHLRYDKRLYALPLIIGIILAIPIILTILLGMPAQLPR
jgi:cytochrome c oxidase subunit 4